MIARFVFEALLEEVYTTPKPGLVDTHDNGAHTDMNCHTFEKSAAAIAPYIAAMYELGAKWQDTPERLFAALRPIGMAAEIAMRAATSGVNTHKGAIFTFGILAAAAGQCAAQSGGFSPQMLARYTQEMTRKPLEREFAAMERREPLTHGERLYRQHGVRGIRGQAQQGFPLLMQQLYPLLCSLRTQDAAPEKAKLQVLLVSMAELQDTCVLSRGSMNDLQWLQAQAAALLAQGGAFAPGAETKLFALNKACIRRNISPGGSADLLAAALFLEKLACYRKFVPLAQHAGKGEAR